MREARLAQGSGFSRLRRIKMPGDPSPKRKTHKSASFKRSGMAICRPSVTTTPFTLGDCISADLANCDGDFECLDCKSKSGVDLRQTVPAGSYPPNAWGLYDTQGNFNELMQDCWHDNYEDAPIDGSAGDDGKGRRRTRRGGSWQSYPRGVCARPFAAVRVPPSVAGSLVSDWREASKTDATPIPRRICEVSGSSGR